MKKPAAILLSALSIGAAGLWWHLNHLPSEFRVSNLEDGNIHILGHGGNGYRSSETINTIASFIKVLECGIDGSELDVQLTADSVPVAFHDRTVDDASDCRGRISGLTSEELAECAEDGLMPTVRKVLSLNWKERTIFSFDLKSNATGNEMAFAHALKKIQDDFPQYRILLESPSVPFLKRLRDSGLNRLYLYSNNPMEGMRACTENGFTGISIDNGLVSTEQVGLLHENGISVMIWGVGNAWDNRDAALKSPDLIQTDDIRQLQRLLKQ